jgi:hypothetical protein
MSVKTINPLILMLLSLDLLVQAPPALALPIQG